MSDARNIVVLFDFQLEVDAEKVLLGELWSFDRHLVVMERYDGSSLVNTLKFGTTNFWVQLHNLPYSFMTTEAATSIGETLRAVSIPRDKTKMRRGSFMRVRVVVDITKPLCRRRIVTWDQNSEG